MAAPSSEILRGIRLHQHFYSSTPVLYATAGATIAEGDVVEDASGLLTLADQDETTNLLGVAMGAGTAAAANVVPYIPFWPGTVWEITMSSLSHPHTILATNLFRGYGLGIDAGNGKPYVNITETTAIAFKVIGAAPEVVLGTTASARVYVVPIATKINWGVT